MKKQITSLRRKLIIIIALAFTLLSSESVFGARTVTYSGAGTTWVSGNNVTVTNTASTSSKTWTNCYVASSVATPSLNASAAAIKTTLDLSTEKIDSVLIIWMNNANPQTITYCWSEADIVFTSSIATLTNGGLNVSSSIASAAGTINCPGQLVKFPSGTNVKSFLVERQSSYNATTTTLNTNYASVNIKQGGTSSPYTTSIGTGSTAYLGKMILYISDKCTTPTSYSISGTATICSGLTTDITLSGSQSGVTYQLLKNGIAEGGTTAGIGSALTWTVSSAGTYTVTTTNAGGYCTTVMSNNAVVTVNLATAINSQSTATATYGQNAAASALNVTAVGTGLSYQWYQSTDASNATPGDDVTVGTNSNSYTPSTATIGTSYYYCVVTGGCSPTTVTSDISGAIIISSPIPSVSRTSGSDPATTTYNVALTPVVYTYVNVADDNNVTASWYTDGTYTTTTTAPSGLSIDKNSPSKTMTLSGTPLAVGTFYYKVIVNEPSGNSISGSVVVASPPAPTVTLTSGSATQAIIPGNAITNIVYTLTNSTDATVTGLPTGLSGNYSSGTYTISGTVDAGVTAGSYPFTVTATALPGYSGSNITANGTIVVKSLTAKNVLYLATDATTTSNDLFLAQLTNSVNYIVTKRDAQSSFTGNYNAYDLIVLHESLTGANAATSGHELNLIKSVDKPILNLKSYFYTTGRWSWGTPNNGNSGKGIKITQPTHPVFSGVTVTDSLYMYGSWRAKNIQPTTIAIGGYEIGKVAGGVAIHDVPASVRLTSGTSKYLMISLLNGAYNDLTADALKLLDNAVNYLLTGTQFVPLSLEISSFTVNGLSATIDNVANTITLQTTDVNLDHVIPTIVLTAPSGTTVDPASGVEKSFYNQTQNYTVSDGINTKVYVVTITGIWTGLSGSSTKEIYFDGKTIHNEANINLQIFDALGRTVVNTTQDINISSLNRGIYIVKSNVGSIKISISK